MARSRVVLAALLTVGLCALAVLGCGSGGGAAATTGASTSSTKAAGRAQPRVATARSCGLGNLLGTLDTLEKRLAAGLSYDQYFEEVDGARGVYEEIDVDRLSLHCLNEWGTPAETALDRYIEAANVWRECRADPSCGTYTIEPRLQRSWRVASHFLGEIR